jgi:hypothetical protein
MNRTVWAAILGGIVGGVAGANLVLHTVHTPVLAPAIAAERPHDVLTSNRIELRDANGRLRAELALSPDGGPGLFFFDSEGRNRLVLGLYSKGEREAPLVVLNDPQERAAGILRLFGPQDTPVLVLKHEGRDRSIFGLNPQSTDPFLTSYGTDGTQHDVFGRY